MSRLTPPVCPKNGHFVRALSLSRVSDPGPGKQDIRSLDDQRTLLQTFLNEQLDSPFELTVIEGSGSGEKIDRKEFVQLTELIETGEYDLIVTEDLGRIVRRIHAHLFAELCVEHGTRLIALNDHIDTAVPGWQDRSIFSAWHHERSNRDTSERIKRSHLNRFQQGGCAQFPIFGIIKPPGAKNDSEWRKDPACEPIYQTMARMLDQSGNYSQVADWLNANGISPGPLSRLGTWTGQTVARVIHNPILKGRRFRNRRKSLRGKNGHYRSVLADSAETKWRHVPHLAFFDEHVWDALIEKLDAKNASYSRGRREAASARQCRGPRKRTRFPGQMTFCGICGRMYVFGGHGQTHSLMCDGARQYACWNGVTFNSVLAAKKILDAVHQEIAALPEFDPAFLSLVNAEAERLDGDRATRRHALEVATAKAERELGHLVQFIATGGDSITVRARLAEAERELAHLQGKIRSTVSEPSTRIEIPSVDELKALACAELASLPVGSWQFQQLMQRLIPRMVVFPVIPCDGGRAVCRARFRLQLGNILSEPGQREVLAQPLERLLSVDLFDVPQRIEHLQQVDALRCEMTERDAAQHLGITVTAAQKSSSLRRKMLELGLTDPYVTVTEPDHVPRLRRHRHPRYQFSPRTDAGQV